ncbi:MAG: TrpB-like pyridoxal phosphate-dependent enzyme [Candidatus Sumerlaeota bacterium]|nr:TrpB-like pyridoxal phosphate-dependent enzyme [Candidatus Sumerlaeota bacterium]
MHSENVITLSKKNIPKRWYNIQPDLRKPLEPPLHPATRQPMTPKEMEMIFPGNLMEQEASQERWIDIPEDVLDVLSMWRPTPLIRARKFEEALETPAQIWYKYEGGSPPGSHKPNTAVPQAYFNKKAGIKRLATETGAGQWGSALAFACYHYGLKCQVYMVKVSYQQKPYRKSMMHLWQAEVTPSPSNKTEVGRKILEKDPECLGSLGIAISEAIEDTLHHPDTKYSLGSVLNHVLMHQTIIGLETKEQLKMAGVKPDIIIGCVGGGSNYAGLALPFMADKLAGKDDYKFIAVEPTACPSLTRGEYRYDFGDTVGMTPLIKMYTLGRNFIAPPIHSGGLRYHGMAPIISNLVNEGLMEAQAKLQIPTFEAAVLFARTEGIIPAPETAHAIRATVDEALKAKKENTPRVILFNFSGHGLLDLSAYDAYFSGELKDYEYVPQKEG